jgi:hypothetical protein
VKDIGLPDLEQSLQQRHHYHGSRNKKKKKLKVKIKKIKKV